MKQYLEKLENWLNLYFGEKAPQLPQGLRRFLTKIAPWLTILAVIFGLPMALAWLGLGHWMMWDRGYFVGRLANPIFPLLMLAALTCRALSIPGLFRLQRSGWQWSYYAILIAGIEGLLAMNIVGMLISLVINFYLLFQLRPLYTVGGAAAQPTMSAEQNTQTPPTIQA